MPLGFGIRPVDIVSISHLRLLRTLRTLPSRARRLVSARARRCVRGVDGDWVEQGGGGERALLSRVGLGLEEPLRPIEVIFALLLPTNLPNSLHSSV